MSDLEARLAKLSPKQRDLLMRKLANKAGSTPAAQADTEIAALPRAEGENTFPLSFSQLRQWILEQLEPGTAAYNLPAAIRLQGPLDADALTAAVDGVVQRHEGLRTVFVDGRGDEPLQLVHPPTKTVLETVD
ncbi:MAG: condensation domain-containing protein, partial [Acidobacteriota bacterium]